MENNTLIEMMQQMSRKELFAIISNPGQQTPELVQAAAEELEKRNEAEARGEIYPPVEEIPEEKPSKWQGPFRKNTVQMDDEQTVPELYSLIAIMAFSVLCSPIFGVMLMASNLRKVGLNMQAIAVQLFGLGYLLASGLVTGDMPFNTLAIVSILLNVIGALIIKQFFWDRYFGSDFQYRKKSLVKPLLITFGIFLLFVLLSMGVL